MSEPQTSGNLTVERSNQNIEPFWSFQPIGGCNNVTINWIPDYDLRIDSVVLQQNNVVDVGSKAFVELIAKYPDVSHYLPVYYWVITAAGNGNSKMFDIKEIHKTFPAGTQFNIWVNNETAGNAVPRFTVYYHRLDTTVNLPGEFTEKPCEFVDYIFGRCHG
jgi:hypothetical protein